MALSPLGIQIDIIVFLFMYKVKEGTQVLEILEWTGRRGDEFTLTQLLVSQQGHVCHTNLLVHFTPVSNDIMMYLKNCVANVST